MALTTSCDYLLVGTGVATLVAAKRLALEGYSVIVVNPDVDFFLEDSELAVDPWCLESGRLDSVVPEEVVSVLAPEYPGAIELWAEQRKFAGFHDEAAPHVRGRSLVAELSADQLEKIMVIKSVFIQKLEGLRFLKRFPAMNLNQEKIQSVAQGENQHQGVLISRVSDWDVSRYRTGVLEFVYERLGSDCIYREVSQLEVTNDGVKFYRNGELIHVKVQNRLIGFWTAKLNKWMQKTFRLVPDTIDLEQWDILSRDSIDPQVIGYFRGMWVWSHVEGSVGQSDRSFPNRLSVLRLADSFAGQDSFRDLTYLCYEFLNWDRFSIRNLKRRQILKWPDSLGFWVHPEKNDQRKFQLECWLGCDGPLPRIIEACSKNLKRHLEGVSDVL